MELYVIIWWAEQNRSTKFDVYRVGLKSAYQRFLCLCHITVLLLTSDMLSLRFSSLRNATRIRNGVRKSLKLKPWKIIINFRRQSKPALKKTLDANGFFSSYRKTCRTTLHRVNVVLSLARSLSVSVAPPTLNALRILCEALHSQHSAPSSSTHTLRCSILSTLRLKSMHGLAQRTLICKHVNVALSLAARTLPCSQQQQCAPLHASLTSCASVVSLTITLSSAS